MTIRIICIGKTSVDYVQQGISDYQKRLQRYAKISWEELPDVKHAAKMPADVLKKEQGKLLLSKVAESADLILLDERGKHQTSKQMAEWLQNKLLHSQRDVCFAIGGAYGFSEEVEKAAKGSLSLSKLTFNHQMVRLILAEQLYRSFTILRGEPYHHA